MGKKSKKATVFVFKYLIRISVNVSLSLTIVLYNLKRNIIERRTLVMWLMKCNSLNVGSVEGCCVGWMAKQGIKMWKWRRHRNILAVLEETTVWFLVLQKQRAGGLNMNPVLPANPAFGILCISISSLGSLLFWISSQAVWVLFSPLWAGSTERRIWSV